MDPRSGKFWLIALVAALALAGGIYGFFHADTAAAVKAVDETSQQVTGSGAVKVGEEVKSDLRDSFHAHNRSIEQAAGE
jgi:hypothetical protein